ncbi:hypothetical protein NBRC3257_3100 [Gluconobacter thailandicus NBRC 3257]|uniref:Uncharacterized protein n=1 Tax=Gluconobacter thailandicus NBRC 3257 TaxID=1381097 RepID=A0ABQ0J0X6_GLUTH|nr:hypothetical protein NBRC3257_3100 [Gluconobacter thailandicus NBRC 3257]
MTDLISRDHNGHKKNARLPGEGAFAGGNAAGKRKLPHGAGSVLAGLFPLQRAGTLKLLAGDLTPDQAGEGSDGFIGGAKRLFGCFRLSGAEHLDPDPVGFACHPVHFPGHGATGTMKDRTRGFEKTVRRPMR